MHTDDPIIVRRPYEISARSTLSPNPDGSWTMETVTPEGRGTTTSWAEFSDEAARRIISNWMHPEQERGGFRFVGSPVYGGLPDDGLIFD
jgi:hypothetical protein